MLKHELEEGHGVIRNDLPSHVLTLPDVTGASFDGESVAVLKSRVAANAPYVKRAAVVGISGLQALIYEGVQAFSNRRIPLFSSRDEAMQWLGKDRSALSLNFIFGALPWSSRTLKNKSI